MPYIRDFAASLTLGPKTFKRGPALRYVKTAYGGLDFVCGGNSVVSRAVDSEDRAVAVKCYRDVNTRRREVYEWLESERTSEWGESGRFFAGGLLLCNDCEVREVDVLVAPWIEGVTLDRCAAELCASSDAEGLATLTEEFDRLGAWLLRQEWAHGDLKPENIIVGDQGLQLIDFDAAYVPTVTAPRTETGTAGYSHPRRTIDMDNRHLDDWAVARISVALHALVADPERGVDSVFPWSDEIFVHGGEPWIRLCELFVSCGDACAVRMCEMLTGGFPELAFLGEVLAERRTICSVEGAIFRGGVGWGVKDSNGTLIEPPVWDEIIHRNSHFYGLLREKMFLIM